ncbi:MAG TPA: hypothetical protein VFC82_06550 [Actinomycetaceae bacterium]|nr:hypothetical protein [Actinomycetaceae bacterium]
MNSLEPRTLSPVQTAFLLLGLLVLADLLFLLGDLYFNVVLPGTRPDLSVSEDQTHPEFFQYTKFVWVIVLLVVLARRQRTWNYLGWLPLFTYLLLDDSLQIHESGGEMIALRYGIEPALGLRAVDLGELIVSAIAGLGALVFIAIGLMRARPEILKFFTDLALLGAVLVLFGVVVDMIHVLFGGLSAQILGLIEDAGEMIAVSAITAYVFGVALGAAPRGLFWRRRGEGQPAGSPR